MVTVWSGTSQPSDSRSHTVADDDPEHVIAEVTRRLRGALGGAVSPPAPDDEDDADEPPYEPSLGL